MSDQNRVSQSVAASEMIRKARELAWGVCLVYPFAGVVVLLDLKEDVLKGDQNLLGLSDWVIVGIVVTVLVAILLRIFFVAVKLGGDLRNTQFLLTQKPERFPSTYLMKRVLGISTNAA